MQDRLKASSSNNEYMMEMSHVLFTQPLVFLTTKPLFYTDRNKIGRAIAQVTSCRLLSAHTRLQPQLTSSDIRGGRHGTEAGFLRVLWFPPLIIIPPLLHTHLSPPHEMCDSPDQAAHYHTLGTKLGASSLTRHLTGFGVMAV
jgi:hypothetical protein